MRLAVGDLQCSNVAHSVRGGLGTRLHEASIQEWVTYSVVM